MIDWLVDNRYLFGFNQPRGRKHVRKQRRKRKKQNRTTRRKGGGVRKQNRKHHGRSRNAR